MKSTHRIALISDIHGNAIALRHALRAIQQHGADEIVCLGDVATLGVAPGEVVDVLRDLKCRCIKGNHDDYVLDAELADDHSGPAPIRAAIDWCRDQLSAEQIGFIAGFGSALDVPIGGGGMLKLFHGSPRSSLVNLFADPPEDELDRELGPDRSVVMAGGHTHIQMVRQHRGTLVVNPGSVGAPFREYPSGGPPVILAQTEFAIIEARDEEIGVSLHCAQLDRRVLAQAAASSSNPMAEQLAAPYR